MRSYIARRPSASSAAVPVAHAVVAREVRTRLRRGDQVVDGHREIGMREGDLANLRAPRREDLHRRFDGKAPRRHRRRSPADASGSRSGSRAVGRRAPPPSPGRPRQPPWHRAGRDRRWLPTRERHRAPWTPAGRSDRATRRTPPGRGATRARRWAARRRIRRARRAGGPTLPCPIRAPPARGPLPPPPPSRRSIRRACGTGPTGCARGRTRNARSTTPWRTRRSWSCRPQSPRRARGARRPSRCRAARRSPAPATRPWSSGRPCRCCP